MVTGGRGRKIRPPSRIAALLKNSPAGFFETSFHVPGKDSADVSVRTVLSVLGRRITGYMDFQFCEKNLISDEAKVLEN